MIEIKNSNEFNIIIQNNNNNIENVDILNCLIDIYITEEIKISILIDSLIISTYFNFYIFMIMKQKILWIIKWIYIFHHLRMNVKLNYIF